VAYETSDIFYDDFSAFPLGEISEVTGALGEYHIVPISHYQGEWREATVYYGWRRPPWKVVEEAGEKAMEATILAERHTPILVTGDEEWKDYTLSALVRPLSFERISGLVFRYQDCRSFYALQLSRDEISLVRRKHEEVTSLASAPFSFTSDQYYELKVECQRRNLRALVNGELLLEAEDEVYLKGKVGFLAEAPARFKKVKVTMPTEAKEIFIHTKEKEERELEELRREYPQPKLWRKIDTAGFGSDRNIRWGDLNGDGKLEMVIAQKLDSIDRGNYQMISCLTACDLEGNILWQTGTPNPQNKMSTADLAFQVHDIDGDGQAEVIFTKDFRLWIADGSSGKIKRSVPTPKSPPSKAGRGVPLERIVGDSILFCNLSGRGDKKAQEIVLKDRYRNIWVFDHNLEFLWTHACNTGHYPACYDIDGDGRDELMVGYTLLDHDGSVLWELDLSDHADGIAIGNFDFNEEGKAQIALAAGDEGFILLDAEGKILRQHRLGHVQKLSVANFRPELKGLEFLTINFWGNPGITAFFDSKGDILSTFEPVHYASAFPLVNWRGDGTELAFLSGHPIEGGLLDGHGRRVVMFPEDGHPTLCSDGLNLTGDERDELVVWDQQQIYIYTQDSPSRECRTGNKIYAPRRNPLYNDSNYKANISIPDWR